MSIKRLGTFTCRFIDSDESKSFSSKEEALEAARRYAGNNS